MPQLEERQADEASIERERASGNKFWSVYVSEAQSYDRGLIDGWRSEMDGLLIFVHPRPFFNLIPSLNLAHQAGLFSGVVATFVIESYKTLNPDPGIQTVVLLSQISHQLANLNNGTAVADAPPASAASAAFAPPPSSLVCNALWFTSLALSLSCALVATLVKQWAQEYQHRTSMFSSPSVRSRVYMYLYYGLRRFNMHTVVGVPPLLLHGALVLFFAGLVTFLVPVNNIIMGISSALLLVFVSVYGTFTLLPLFFFDSPFQTPLSRILWSLNQSLGRVLRAYVLKACVRMRVAVTDPEAPSRPPAPADTRPQSQSMVDALKSAALHPTVETETRAVAWAIRTLSDDDALDSLVEGLPQTVWDFDRGKPRSVYLEQFKSLLQDPQVRLCQRLADFMAGSNSNLLEHSVRVRRQLSVLRAIWAICAFCVHTESPLEYPIGDTDPDKVLLGSRFLDSDEVQSMVLAVLALVRLNIIESESRQRAPEYPLTQTSNYDRTKAGEQRQAEKKWTYVQYLVALSKSPTSFERDVTNSLFHRSQILFTGPDGYIALHAALEELIQSGSDEAADNLVFSARQMITAIAGASTDQGVVWISGLAPFLVRHPSLAAPSDPDAISQPGPKYTYTRFLCHCLCFNFTLRSHLEESFDFLQLIYRHSLDVAELTRYPGDLDTHLLVLRTLHSAGAQAADIHPHRLAVIVQGVVLKRFRLDWSQSGDLSESAKLLSIFEDEDWFRAVICLDNETWMERASTQATRDSILDCARVGVVTTFFEQCARNPDQTQRELDFETLESVQTVDGIYSVLPAKMQRRFADAVSGFLRKYPRDTLADCAVLNGMLSWAIHEHIGFIDDLDALQVLDTAVFDVQTDYEQETHRKKAEWIRGRMQKRLHRPERIFAAFVSLVTEVVDSDPEGSVHSEWSDITDEE
ncbi:unnamed protein product [Mycena citricolor]|uniref:DUF6535 domain-containing protein n=1 Tax=Mycena citricolor TaxID=2018698 RepID=A0AAD2HS60_9AGAR|nr:unnamed protein product [Mycena citricolor]